MGNKVLEVEHKDGEYTVKFAPGVIFSSEAMGHLKNANKELRLAVQSVIRKVGKTSESSRGTKIDVEEEKKEDKND